MVQADEQTSATEEKIRILSQELHGALESLRQADQRLQEAKFAFKKTKELVDALEYRINALRQGQLEISDG